jgi:hypothetical protein
VTFFCGVVLISFEEEQKLGKLMEWVIAMKLDWAFVAVITFYFAPHIFAAIGGKK